MSALTDLFTAMANKIRSKTGTQTVYTPAQMVSDGIDDVYDAGYAAGGGGGVTPTSITPSNSSPASMTAGNAYEPTANGYAISSYSSITPSSSSPVSLTSGSMYKPSSSGYAIDSYSSISPSSGGTYFSSGMKKMSSSGYAYPSQVTTTYVTGTDSATASSSSQPGTIFTYTPSTEGIHLIVVSAMTNVSNSEGYIRINSSNLGTGPKDYIPTHGTGSSVNSVKSAYRVLNSNSSTMSVQLGWDGSHSSCWFKYSINIFRI